MNKDQVRIDYFFDHPESFPWDILNLSRPYYAPVHAYICAAARLICSPNERHLLQDASLRELIRFSEVSPMAGEIAKFCQGNGTDCRHEKAKLVCTWMRYTPTFRAYMQQLLDNLYRRGVISIPEGAKP